MVVGARVGVALGVSGVSNGGGSVGVGVDSLGSMSVGFGNQMFQGIQSWFLSHHNQSFQSRLIVNFLMPQHSPLYEIGLIWD
jgi:hypothetical protein